VDVVWLLLFIIVYVFGSDLLSSELTGLAMFSIVTIKKNKSNNFVLKRGFYKSYTSLALILLLLNIFFKFTLVAECANENISNNNANIQILMDQLIHNAREDELPEINDFLQVLVDNGAVPRPVYTHPIENRPFGWESLILFVVHLLLVILL
jgi:hypothetical protein